MMGIRDGKSMVTALHTAEDLGDQLCPSNDPERRVPNGIGQPGSLPDRIRQTANADKRITCAKPDP